MIICVSFVSCQGITYYDKRNEGVLLNDSLIPRFEILDDVSVKVKGSYLYGEVLQNLDTHVSYVLLKHESESYSLQLLDPDGTPRALGKSGEICLIVSRNGSRLEDLYLHQRIIVDSTTRVQYVTLHKERENYSFPLLDSRGIPILFDGELWF